MHYIIKATCKHESSGVTKLGDGPTEKCAWANVYGPKPWCDITVRLAAKAWCEWVDTDGHGGFHAQFKNDH